MDAFKPTIEPTVTLQTIAGQMGLSRTTISNAYNRPDQLAPELRTHILEIAEGLGYAGPNPTARSLRRGKSGAVGLLLTENLSYAVTDPASVLLLQGLAGVCDIHSTNLLLLPYSPGGDRGASAVQDAVVDGFIVYTTNDDDPRLEAISRRKLPTVFVDEPRRDGFPFVGVDDYNGARQAALHLLEHGHRDCAVIIFPLAEDGYRGLVDPRRVATATYHITRDRLRGYTDAFQTAGIPVTELPVWECDVNSIENGIAGAKLLLDRNPRPTALLCLSDQLALGAIRAITGQGLRVPEDVSVVGFDDAPDAAASSPPLTTVRQPLREKGRVAGELLLGGWGDEPPTILLPTELVVRSSSGSRKQQQGSAI